MPQDRTQRYDLVPPIPTYDEALASGGPAGSADWPPPSSPIDERTQLETESQSLLTSNSASATTRRHNGYRPPTAETDDEDSTWGSDDDESDETIHVRREMQEFDIEEPADRSRSSIWGKRIPFSLSLPQWKWAWRWRLPRLRPNIQLPSRPGEDSGDPDSDSATRRRCAWPKLSGASAAMSLAVIGRVFLIIVVVGVLYLLFMSDLFSSMARRLGGSLRFDPEDVRTFVQSNVEGRRMRASVKHYTAYAHIAGTEGGLGFALDMERMFTLAGLDQVIVDEYYVYLNYPKPGGRAIEIMGQDGTTVSWSAKLEEEEVQGGSMTAGHQTLVFHGHSKAGDVKGPLIYANYGSREDFRRLADSGIDTKGAIALVRYYGTQNDPGLKVKAAELAGFAGCIIYSDPAEDGFRQGDVAPSGRFMPADGVQRGSVSLTNWVVGDVLTPGWGSKKGLPRMKKEQTQGLNKIPSLPLAWRDAQVLLQHLKGFGEKVPDGWAGGVPDIDEWWSGNLSSPIVHLKNEQDEIDQQKILNVYGKIEGIEQTAKSIIIGSHRDAWAFGATDPHSGTAVMVEMARVFGLLVSKGWRPLRTIEFMSWDAEEYNMVGSTEFVEQNVDFLRENAFAYINLDAAVSGNEFHASGSPVFKTAVLEVLDRVYDPNFNATLRELWQRRSGELEDLGSGSDYVPFQDIAGTSSLDIQFKGPKYPYHSSYDNYEWVNLIGDPGFTYHTLMGQVVALLMLELSDKPILPFDMVHYANNLARWIADLETWMASKGANQEGAPRFSLDPLKMSLNEISSAVKAFVKFESKWDAIVMGGSGYESTSMTNRRCQYNNMMSDFETSLLDLENGGGIPNRTQFKHVIFGPQAWSGNDPVTFPAIRDAVEVKDWELAIKLVEKTGQILSKAAAGLLDAQK